MSVRAPTFPELVAEASSIVHARVVAVTSRAVTSSNGQRAVKTFVTFETMKALKGAPAARFTLSFLGGKDKASGENWIVPGMPVFNSGDEDIVFATGGESICPLVGAMHGRYRVATDASTGRQYVARDDGTPLHATNEVGRPIAENQSMTPTASSIVSALTPEEFEQKIATEVAHPSATARAP